MDWTNIQPKIMGNKPVIGRITRPPRPSHNEQFYIIDNNDDMVHVKHTTDEIAPDKYKAFEVLCAHFKETMKEDQPLHSRKPIESTMNPHGKVLE